MSSSPKYPGAVRLALIFGLATVFWGAIGAAVWWWTK